MILCDVNVLLHAFIKGSSAHALCKAELERARTGTQQIAISEFILSAVLRIATNRKVFKPTPTPEQVFPFLDALRTDPQAVVITPEADHWRIFQGLVKTSGVSGPDVTTGQWRRLRRCSPVARRR